MLKFGSWQPVLGIVSTFLSLSHYWHSSEFRHVVFGFKAGSEAIHELSDLFLRCLLSSIGLLFDRSCLLLRLAVPSPVADSTDRSAHGGGMANIVSRQFAHNRTGCCTSHRTAASLGLLGGRQLFCRLLVLRVLLLLEFEWIDSGILNGPAVALRFVLRLLRTVLTVSREYGHANRLRQRLALRMREIGQRKGHSSSNQNMFQHRKSHTRLLSESVISPVCRTDLHGSSNALNWTI
jgi:hypothetical protein